MTINHGFVFLRICSIKEVSLVYDQLQIIIVDYTLVNFPAPSIEKETVESSVFANANSDIKTYQCH